MASIRKPINPAPIEQSASAPTRQEAVAATEQAARQIVLRIKSLLSYAHRVGYLQFNAGAVIKAHAESRSAL